MTVHQICPPSCRSSVFREKHGEATQNASYRVRKVKILLALKKDQEKPRTVVLIQDQQRVKRQRSPFPHGALTSFLPVITSSAARG